MLADAVAGGVAAIVGGTELVPCDAADCHAHPGRVSPELGPPVEVDAPALCAADGSETGMLSRGCIDMRLMGMQVFLTKLQKATE